MAKRGRSYQPTEADRLFVERAVKAGTSILEIAAALNLHDDTLRKHFRYEISVAREHLKGEAVRVLEDSLRDNSLEAAKFVLARVAGWTERRSLEHTGPDGGPIRTADESKTEAELIEQAQKLGIDPEALGLTGGEEAEN